MSQPTKSPDTPPATASAPTTPTSKPVHHDDKDDGPKTVWAKIRYSVREPLAEFLGTMIFVIFQTATNCLTATSPVASSPHGDYLSTNFSAAVGLALGVWISGGISGGHINPAVTIAMAAFRGFSWKKVPVYILAQVLGGVVGAFFVYMDYVKAINIFEGGVGVRTVPGSAGFFATYPLAYVSSATAFWDEFLGAAILLIGICAVTDKRNGPPPAGLVPLTVFLMLLGLSSAFGQTGYSFNPARDFGPRVMTGIVGYGREVFNFRKQYWLWGGVLAPVLGALIGTLIYDLFIYTGKDSPLNKPPGYKPPTQAQAEVPATTV